MHKRRRGRKEISERVPITRTIVPDKQVTFLTYYESGVLNGAPSVAMRWNTNSAYDPKTPVGGSSVNGFNTWSAFYSFNRVVSYKIDLTLTNAEVAPVNLEFVHLNTDPTTTPTSYPIYATQAFGSSAVLGGLSGANNQMRYHRAHSIRQIVGDRMPVTADRYVGSSTSSPSDLTYFGVSATSASGFEMSDGVFYKLRMTLKVEFFDRKNFDDVTSLFAEEPQLSPRTKEVLEKITAVAGGQRKQPTGRAVNIPPS